MNFETLKEKQRRIREGFPESHGLRVHRALSWLQRAELAASDPDAAFIFFWISFNAAYADERPDVTPTGERKCFEDYFEKLGSLDRDNRVYNAIWTKFPGPIKQLLDNRYVYQPFWSHQNQVPGNADWEERFTSSKRRISRALAAKETKVILSCLFDRLYVLRNQLVHGGATWNSSVNRAQVTDGARILAFLVPIFIDIMMDNPQVGWGAPYYPVVE
jgi:hypothetical protein